MGRRACPHDPTAPLPVTYLSSAAISLRGPNPRSVYPAGCQGASGSPCCGSHAPPSVPDTLPAVHPSRPAQLTPNRVALALGPCVRADSGGVQAGELATCVLGAPSPEFSRTPRGPFFEATPREPSSAFLGLLFLQQPWPSGRTRPAKTTSHGVCRAIQPVLELSGQSFVDSPENRVPGLCLEQHQKTRQADGLVASQDLCKGPRCPPQPASRGPGLRGLRCGFVAGPAGHSPHCCQFLSPRLLHAPGPQGPEVPNPPEAAPLLPEMFPVPSMLKSQLPMLAQWPS